MYCLGFGKSNTNSEEKKDDSPSTGYQNMDTLGPDYVAPYERANAHGKPLFPDVEMDTAVVSTSTHQQKAMNFDQPMQLDSGYIGLHDRESRFSQELRQVHKSMSNRKERTSAHIQTRPTNKIEAFASHTGREAMDISFVHETNKKNESKRELRKENLQLRKDLRRTRRVLECEKAQKIALRDRMANLEHQIDELREDLPRDPRSNRHPERSDREGGKMRDLEKKLEELQQKYENEKLLNQNLEIELNVVKKENDKNKEKVRMLMFQQNPNSTTKFQDIGPVDHDITETTSGVGKYEFGRKLGEGHYGKVAVGKCYGTSKKFAIKVLNKERITRYKDLQQVAIEVHVLRKYPHPNIVRLQEVIHAPNHIYLVTELCRMDLHEYHNKVGLSEFGAKQVILGILKPLYHLHSHGICHLDLKPENILLGASVDLKNVSHYDVRLCDFGLVNMARNPTESKEIVRKGYACGTPGFFAPEMILVNEFEGRQADMWSLGCIVLELTLGFTQEWIDSYEVIESHPAQFRKGIETCLEEIAPENYPKHRKLLDLIHQCLYLDPKKRVDAKSAMVHKWLEEVFMADEGRQETAHYSSEASLSPPGSPTSLYEERGALMPCMIQC